ncbi:hypothetical protein BC826DRAFT_596249 [Russula brevipes]|nr:hypothetical protein BC826DRAFT_596249 [Russula brevipes]
MYLERAEDQDRRWPTAGKQMPMESLSSPVCFLLLLRRLSGSPSRTLSQIRRIPPRSILQTSISSSPVQMGPVFCPSHTTRSTAILSDHVGRMGQLSWFLSLVMSLTCACWPHYNNSGHVVTSGSLSVDAVLIDGRGSAHSLPKASTAAPSLAVETLPALLHSSLLLFFVGLAIFLFNIHHTVFTIILWWVGLLVGIYMCITFMPIFRQDSPYYTPLSLSAWFLVASLLYSIFGFLSWLQVFHIYTYDTWIRLFHLKTRYSSG